MKHITLERNSSDPSGQCGHRPGRSVLQARREMQVEAPGEHNVPLDKLPCLFHLRRELTTKLVWRASIIFLTDTKKANKQHVVSAFERRHLFADTTKSEVSNVLFVCFYFTTGKLKLRANLMNK